MRHFAIKLKALLILAFLPALMAAFAPFAFAETSVSVTLRNSHIDVGESTQLSVIIKGSSDITRPKLPEVDGLHISGRGQSTQMQYINGKMSNTVTFLYQVDAEKEGVFRIPPIQVRIASELIESEELTLSVGPDAAPGSNSGNSPQLGGAQAGNPPFPSGSSNSTARAKESQAAFIRIEASKNSAYVGEYVPIELKAYFADALRVSLNNKPTLSGGAFTIHNTNEQPRESQEAVSGRLYTVLTWNMAISAAKDGEIPLSAQLGATLLTRQKSRRADNPLFDNPLFGNHFFDFQDDFFDNFFGAMTEKNVNLSSPLLNFSVKELPENGKPPSFGGAVGSFNLKVYPSVDSAKVGDPITLRIKISGSGNFDRVTKPLLSSDEYWKVYNPEVAFKPLDAVSFRGEKSYEQVLIPQDPSIKEIPPLIFSYFDPLKEEYRELKSDPIPISVSGKALEHSAKAGAPSQSQLSPEPKQPLTREQEQTQLAPIHIEKSRTFTSLAPLYTRIHFIELAGFFVILAVIGIFCRYLFKKRISDPDYALHIRARHEIQKLKQELQRALSEADSKAFLHGCKRIAQLKFAEKWQLEAEAITSSDIQSRAPGSYPESVKIFDMADAVLFSGLSLSTQDLKRIYDAFLNEMEKLS